MHPAALLAAAETGFAKIHVLLAWDEESQPRRPVGFWALQERRDLPLVPAFLEALPYNYAFTSNAVIDSACADGVVAAFFDAVRRDLRLPKIISLRSFEADSVVYPAMLRHLAGTGRHRELHRFERPFADRSSGTRKSRSACKKLRSVWNRISAAGSVEIVNDRRPAEAEAAFETFLVLEAASWKGAEGTALLSDADDARFARRLFHNLAAQDLASVALLSVDDQAIAAQVLFYSGRQAYTWKTAFNSAFAQFSPGALLIDKVTESLLESGRIVTIDSCSYADGFMARLFTGRRTMVDALIDVRSRSSLAFAMDVACHQGHEQIRRVQDRMRRAIKRPR
ncbi:GNAT family N-acetyltransferase [Bradyrhizobium sp. SSUT112]|uniref:GNAT family N-acetyltransferase n=1 Tax=Bradyrhizobium sp. SSUT112 TaxID=3040604 RepID=UPI00244B731A|nr:GNAT family N-acetyltransferase [Bradyrhizobium sp. SSUT112]MDH2351423.1 GNAT family N-acetyltransferase [Bradyrhizobium sp. SSUT112]